MFKEEFMPCLGIAPAYQVPDEEFVIVSARGQVLVVGGPLQAAYLLAMADLQVDTLKKAF